MECKNNAFCESNMSEASANLCRFRWAVCQIDELKKCLNLTMLRQQLRSLPTSLDQTYERILLNIDKTYSNYALRMRCWLTYSARPLRLLELAEIFPIDVEEDPGFDPERRFPEPEDILLTCSSLVTVTVDAEEVYVLESEIDGEIKLAHFPVKEYLISNRIQESKASKYSLHETYANLSIAKDCLLYLLYISERVPETSRNTLEFPLASYAARNWAEHTRVKEIENSSIIIDLIIKLFESDGKTYANWLYSYDGGPGLQNPQLNHPSLFGILGPAPTKRPLYHDHEYLIDLLEPSRRLIDRCAEIDARQWYYGATLRVASANGRTEIVRLLLEAGAEPNFVIGDRVHDGALFAASSCGYHMIVRLLLDAGAEIRHGPSPGYYSPLHAAAHNGHHSVVAVLIGAGVDVNLNAGMWKGNADTALNLASQRGFDDVVELLITAGADVNIERGLKNSSLAEASFWGHNSTVKILLDAGAEVNMDGENCEQALMVASEQGHVGVVKQLLKVGADLETFSTSALFLAAANGKADVVSVLLDAGADPDSMGYTLNERKKPGALYEASGGGYQRIVDTRIYSKYRGTALQATSVSGQTKIVRLLLEANVDVNAKDTEGEASLQTAVNGKQIQVVEQLLSAGADVNATGGSCGGALAAALNIGQDEIAELLIKLGANANGQVPYYGSVLQSAAAKGKEGVVSQLLGAGADINMQGGRYGCALHAASACGHGKVVERLLQAGAPVNIQRRDGSPLQLAAREGHDMVIKLLLQHGTDVEMEGGNHDRPLFEAAKNGHLSTVRLLLDGGANVNAECGSLRGSVCAAAASSHKKSFEIVHLLLDAGADPKRQCEALGEAARRGDDEVVKLLLGAGVDPNSESEWVNPLQDAATWGQVSTLKILLEAGADVKRGDGFQYLGSKLSPLFWSPNRHETLTLLLEAGAEIKGSREGTLDDDDDDDWGPWNRI